MMTRRMLAAVTIAAGLATAGCFVPAESTGPADPPAASALPEPAATTTTPSAELPRLNERGNIPKQIGETASVAISGGGVAQAARAAA